MESSASQSNQTTSRLDALTEKYPLLFTKQEQEPFTLFGFECGDGWYNILAAAFDALYAPFRNAQNSVTWYTKSVQKDPDDEKAQEHLQAAIAKLDATQGALPLFVQIKEKFGTLCMYYDGGDARASGIVDMAENMSSCTCEVCGAPATTRPGRWVVTLCDAHATKK
jgi:hypothetical protein